MKGLHDRMPVILKPEVHELWLEPEFHGQGKLLGMLGPYPAEDLEAFPVCTVVNSPNNQTPDCIEALV